MTLLTETKPAAEQVSAFIANLQGKARSLYPLASGGNVRHTTTIYNEIRSSGLAACMAEKHIIDHSTYLRIPRDLDLYTTDGNCSSACSLYVNAQHVREI